LALRRLGDARWPIDGFNDHGTHEAVYLRDPEENGLELCWDRPREEWARDEDGHFALGGTSLTSRAYFERVCSGPGCLRAAIRVKVATLS